MIRGRRVSCRVLKWFLVRSKALQNTATMLYCIDTIGIGEVMQSSRAYSSVRMAPRED